MAKEDSPYFYNIKKLNILFAVSSAIFFAMVVWTVLDDANREWKNWQTKFHRLEYQKTKQELAQAKQNVDAPRLKELQNLLAQAQSQAKGQKSEIAQAQKALDVATDKLYVENAQYQVHKSYYDTAKYRYEEAAKHDPAHAQKEKEELDRYTRLIEDYQDKIKALEEAKAGRDAHLGELLKQQQDLQDQIAAQRKEVDTLAKKLAKVQPSFLNSLRDLPMLDFMAPNLRIAQILPEGLTDDYNFVKVPKVDRCTTCHLSINKKGYEDAPQPFTTHPDLDLYLDGASPHPMEKFGCTSCHLGNGRGTSFFTAAHAPNTPEQAAQWKRKYGWEPYKHWAWPMLPKSEVEASCITCHAGVMEVPKAERLNAARNLFAELGCVGCHATEGFNALRKVGPSLEHVSSKADKAWLEKWITDPKSFHPDTRMPRFFGLSNAPMDDRQRAIVDAIAAYLLDNSAPADLSKAGPAGDAKRGQELVKSVGCLGCHSVGEWKANNFGPAFDGAGSKLNKPWLMAWLKDPKKLFPQTKMPNLRLTDQETSDIADYLLSLRNEAFDSQPAPQTNAGALDDLVLEQLEKKTTAQEAKTQLASMDTKQKELFTGKAMILHYGCFGCHDIKGFEDAKKIGTELTEEGSKPPERLDFGFVPIEHTRRAFFRQKLTDPRSFDMGKVKSPAEKLKMPQFALTPEQIDLLMLHLDSLTKHSVPMERQRLLSSEDRMVEDGRVMVRNFHCQGCHVIDGKGGNIAQTLEDKGLAPPPLNGEGKKVQGDWLYTFLKGPTPIRPWLKIRMPTFGFSDEQSAKLVRHFQAKDKVPAEFKSLAKKPMDQAAWQTGKEMFEKLQCIQCHQAASLSKKSPADLAPELTMAANRLREDWIVQWLHDPQVLQEGTRMPTFFPEGQSPLPNVLNGNVDDQINALKTFVVNYKLEKSK